VTRALIVTNPAATRAGARGLAAARRRLEAAGLRVTVAETRAMGDGALLARAAVQDGVGIVIAHGGDGTAADVATGLVGTSMPLGLLPAGTGNVLAGSLGVGRSLVAAADTILAGATRAIDLGRLTTSAGTRYFAVNAATGFAADLMAKTAQRAKRRYGVTAYVARAFVLATNLVRAASRVEVDGVVHEGYAATVIVANFGQVVPGVLSLGSHILPDDGVLDVAVFDAASLASAMRSVWRLFQGRPDADRGITFYRGGTVKVSTEPTLSVQSDGEVLGTTPMSVELLPRALTVIVPASSRLAGGIGGR
jgi:YegS/Rv2252/BmrU family lipid kinase